MQVIIPNTTGTLMVSGVHKHDGTCTKLMRKPVIAWAIDGDDGSEDEDFPDPFYYPYPIGIDGYEVGGVAFYTPGCDPKYLLESITFKDDKELMDFFTKTAVEKIKNWKSAQEDAEA